MRNAAVFCIVSLTAVALLHACSAAESPGTLDLGGFTPFDAGVAPVEEADRIVQASHAEAFTPFQIGRAHV